MLHGHSASSNLWKKNIPICIELLSFVESMERQMVGTTCVWGEIPALQHWNNVITKQSNENILGQHFLNFRFTSYKNWQDIKLKNLSYFFISDGEIYFSKKYEMMNIFYKTCEKMENVNFIFKFIPSSYIKNFLEIIVKLKIKKCWPYREI